VDGHIVSKVLLEESISLGSVKKQQDIPGLRSPYIVPAVVILIIVILVAIGYYFAATGAFDRFFVKKPLLVQKDMAAAQTGLPVKAEARVKAEVSVKAEVPVKTEAPADSVAQKTEPSFRKVVVIKDAVNVRTAPGLEALRIGMIFRGATLKVVGEQSDRHNTKWYKVILYEDREGWVSESVVTVK